MIESKKALDVAVVKAALSKALAAPAEAKSAGGAGRVYVVVPDNAHAALVGKAAKALGMIYQKRAYYGLRNALYVGYINFVGREWSKALNIVDELSKIGISAYDDLCGD